MKSVPFPSSARICNKLTKKTHNLGVNLYKRQYIYDWFVEFLFGCMSELLTLNNRKETKRLPLQLPYPQALGSEYKLVSDGPVALPILRS